MLQVKDSRKPVGNEVFCKYEVLSCRSVAVFWAPAEGFIVQSLNFWAFAGVVDVSTVCPSRQAALLSFIKEYEMWGLCNEKWVTLFTVLCLGLRGFNILQPLRRVSNEEKEDNRR